MLTVKVMTSLLKYFSYLSPNILRQSPLQMSDGAHKSRCRVLTLK